MFICELPNEFLRILASCEPIEETRDWWHISISCCVKLSDGDYSRKPTNTECQEVIKQITDQLKFYLLQDFIEDSEGGNTMIRHFWSPVT